MPTNSAGLVIDLYDCPQDVAAIFTTLESVPESIKTAHALSAEERAALPDTVYALVIPGEGGSLRKYACIDEGNTLLNIAYFFKHGHKLPAEAQKTAAANLIQACGWYHIEVPEELTKVAFGVGRALTALSLPSQLKATAGAVKGNLAAADTGGGLVVPYRQQKDVGMLMKGAEASGTSIAPLQGPGDLESAVRRGKPGDSATSMAKSASVGRLVDGHRGEEISDPEAVVNPKSEQPASIPQSKPAVLKPCVCVQGKEPPKVLAKKASRTAYDGRYPLDTYEQVKTASAYFEDQCCLMEPGMRHVFANSLTKRASELGISLGEMAQAYGTCSYAPDAQLRAGVDMRIPYLQEKDASVLEELFEKRAQVSAELYCSALEELDSRTGVSRLYGSRVWDPYLSTYGSEKRASESWVDGNDYITSKQLENYSVTAPITLNDDFGPDFVKEFRKDPWGVFMSMPLNIKRRLARAASDNGATGMHDVQ